MTELNCDDCKLLVDGKCDINCAYETHGGSWIPAFDGAKKYTEEED